MWSAPVLSVCPYCRENFTAHLKPRWSRRARPLSLCLCSCTERRTRHCLLATAWGLHNVANALVCCYSEGKCISSCCSSIAVLLHCNCVFTRIRLFVLVENKLSPFEVPGHLLAGPCWFHAPGTSSFFRKLTSCVVLFWCHRN